MIKGVHKNLISPKLVCATEVKVGGLWVFKVMQPPVDHFLKSGGYFIKF